MAKTLNLCTAIILIVTVSVLVCYRWTSNEMLLPLTITFGTISYHFVMRLLVGFIFDRMMMNKADYTKGRWLVSTREMRLYERLKIKMWKGKMPTYHSSLFDCTRHSWEEIVQAMCQAELVHETIAVLSFLPIAAGIWFGDFPVFVITSVAAAVVDMTFAIVQRYNRGRILRLMRR